MAFGFSEVFLECFSQVVGVVAARTRQGHTENKEDRITAKLPALHFYQLSLPVPPPPSGSFDLAAAQDGKTVFEGKARCASCHVPPLFTEPGWNLHKAEEIGIDEFQAKRSPDERYGPRRCAHCGM